MCVCHLGSVCIFACASVTVAAVLLFAPSTSRLDPPGRNLTRKYMADKRAQDELIARQQDAIESMQRRRGQRDFYVDSAIVVACYITCVCRRVPLGCASRWL
jgi:hypothetical protein